MRGASSLALFKGDKIPASLELTASLLFNQYRNLKCTNDCVLVFGRHHDCSQPRKSYRTINPSQVCMSLPIRKAKGQRFVVEGQLRWWHIGSMRVTEYKNNMFICEL